TPDQTEQAKRLSTNSHRRNQRRTTTKHRVECESKWEGQISFQQAQRFTLREHFNDRWKRSHVERFSVGIEESLYGIYGRFRRRFERSQTDSTTGWIQHSKS